MDTTQATTVNLGQPISRHPMTFGQTWGAIILSIIFMGAGVLAYLGISSAFKEAPNVEGTITNPAMVTILPIIVGVVLLLAGLYRLYTALRNWSMTASVHENGLEYTTRDGTQQFTWDEIEDLNMTITRIYGRSIIPEKRYQITVQLHDGRFYGFDDRFKKVKKLWENLQERLAARQLPDAMANISAGNHVQFGELKLNQKGIYWFDKTLSWEEVGKITIKDSGDLSISKRGSRLGAWKLKTSDVPNTALLCALVKKLSPTE